MAVCSLPDTRQISGPTLLPAISYLMFTFQDVLIDAVWIFGLSGLLATGSYFAWYRDVRGWSWRHTLRTPRFLLSLCLSLTVFCIGVALNGVVSVQRPPMWETLVWSLLSLFLLVQSVIYGIAGDKNGWDTSMEGMDNQ